LYPPGFLEFTTQLSALIATTNPPKTSPLHWVLSTHETLSGIHPEYTHGIDPIDREYALLSAVHSAHLQTTSFLSPPNQPGGKSPFFRYLASCHLRHLVRLFEPAYNKLAPGDHPFRTGMAAYFVCLEPMLDMMEREIAAGGVPGLRVPEGCWSREQLMSGWVVLVFRAMLWNRCHFLVKGATVPLQYCGSQLPVYIG
jgi:hypothetical protein